MLLCTHLKVKIANRRRTVEDICVDAQQNCRLIVFSPVSRQLSVSSEGADRGRVTGHARLMSTKAERPSTTIA